MHSCGWHLPGCKGAGGFSGEDGHAAAHCHQALNQSPPGSLLLPSVALCSIDPKSCLRFWGYKQQSVIATLSPGPQKLPSRILPHQAKICKPESFSLNQINQFSKAGSAQNPVQSGGTQHHVPLSILLPISLPLSHTVHISAEMCLSRTFH